MNKAEYIAALRRELQALPESEREEAIKYYSDYFDDAGEEKEAEVIAELGAPRELAAFILNNFACVPEPIQKSGRTDDESKRDGGGKNMRNQKNLADRKILPGTKILLLILLVIITFPIWGPMVTAVGGTLFGLFVAVLATGAALVVVAVVVLLLGVFFVVLGIVMLFSTPLSALLLAGQGLMLTGAGILCVMGGIWLCAKIIPALIRGIVKLCRMPFVKKEAAA